MAQPAAFDPDAHLASSESSTSFDPDAYLSQRDDHDTAHAKTRANVSIGESYTDEYGRSLIKAKYPSLDRHAESPSTGELFGSMGRNLVGGVAHGVGTLVDVATGTSPGEGSYAERFASPFQGEPTQLEQLDPRQVRWHEAATNALNETIGTGPLAQTLRERVPQAAEAIATVVPLLKTGGALAARSGRVPLTAAPGDPIVPGEPAAGMRRDVPLSASPTEPTMGPEIPARPASAPELLEMPSDSRDTQPLSASGAPRKAAYSDLEGESPKFVDETPVAHNGTQLPRTQQAKRAELLERIGIPAEEQRNSAVTGDAKAASTDYQSSKLDNAGGDHLRKTLDNERTAITGYSENLVNQTGGTPGLGETEVLQRGQNILAPLDDLKDHFDAGIKSLYKAADERAGDVPISTPETHKLLGDESEFLGTVEGESLLKGVRARMKALGMMDADGNAASATVKQAERFKQYLGDQWTPRTSRLIRRLKDSVDDDVTKAAGEDIYSAARSLRAARARVLDDPKGIASIIDADGPAGINRTVAIEKIPAKVATLPVAQFDHIIKTLQGVPEELRPQAQAAVAEIKAQFANKVHEAGTKNATQWNAKAVTQYLNANSARMKSVFTADELANFGTLNDAGHVLRFDPSYPGAAIQGRNLARSGVMRGAIEHGATMAGGAAGSILGPVGAAAGASAGRAAAGRFTGAMAERAALKAAKGRVGTLADLLKPKESK